MLVIKVIFEEFFYLWSFPLKLRSYIYIYIYIDRGNLFLKIRLYVLYFDFEFWIEIQFSKILKRRNFIHSHSRSSVSISVQSWKISKARAEEEFKDRCFVVNIRSMIEREQVFFFFFFFFRWTSIRINVEDSCTDRGATNERDKGNRAAVRSRQIGLTTMWFIGRRDDWYCIRFLTVHYRLDNVRWLNGSMARERGVGTKYDCRIFSMVGWRRKLW